MCTHLKPSFICFNIPAGRHSISIVNLLMSARNDKDIIYLLSIGLIMTYFLIVRTVHADMYIHVYVHVTR